MEVAIVNEEWTVLDIFEFQLNDLRANGQLHDGNGHS